MDGGCVDGRGWGIVPAKKGKSEQRAGSCGARAMAESVKLVIIISLSLCCLLWELASGVVLVGTRARTHVHPPTFPAAPRPHAAPSPTLPALFSVYIFWGVPMI
jgi:hypothetical protein